MKMEGFEWHKRDDNQLKEMALNYVQIWKGNWDESDEETREPFFVINEVPEFWHKISDVLFEVSEATDISSCMVAGPYDQATRWLPDNWGRECYVYMNYDGGDVSSGIEFAEGDRIDLNAVQLSELAAHLQAGTSPNKYNRLAINYLSPTQYFMVLQYCIQLYGDSVDITKNDFTLAPFIFRPGFDFFIEDLEDDGTEDIDQLAKLLESKLHSYIDSVYSATDANIVCGYFKP